ncbi:MAG: cysteine desulfurase family protein [PVC group bacterium]
MTAVYLDYNATTPLDPEARAEMDACLDRSFANPSSIHAAGREARRIVDMARERVARLIGARPEEIIFTGGGTEANNLAILGGLAAPEGKRRRILTTAIEHQAVLNPCRHLEKSGWAVTFLPVDRQGRLDPATVSAALGEDTALVSVMLANNDIGTVEPVAEISPLARARGVLFHTDAVQAAGKIPVDVKKLGVDLLSFSAHKLHGPKGAGALWVRAGTRLFPLFFGGHQERGLRPGTENVAAIAGFGKACELAAARREEDAARLTALRAAFEEAVRRGISGAVINGEGAERLPNTSNICFDGLDGELLVINLDLLGVEASTGAACGAGSREPSHVLLALGRSAPEARSAVRFSFGRGTTTDEATRAFETLRRAIKNMRESRR